MSLDALARADNKAFLDMDGERLTLTSPDAVPVVYPDVPCRVIRRGAVRDIEGMTAIGEETIVSISTLALDEKGITDPEVLKAKGWIVTYDSRAYRIGDCPIDYTSGVVTAFLKRNT